MRETITVNVFHGIEIKLEDLYNYKLKGDWELDMMRLDSNLQKYFHDVLGILNDGINKEIQKSVNQFIKEHYPEYDFELDYSGWLFLEEEAEKVSI